MNQPPNPASPRSERPQLFKAPARAKQHADFGPSILATIDGGQSRFTEPRDRSPAKRLLMLGSLIVLCTAAYVVVKVHAARVASVPDALTVKLQQPSVLPVQQVAVAASAPAPAASVGAASIETVTPALAATPVAASAVAPATNVAASLGNMQMALVRSEAATAPVKKPVSNLTHSVRSAPVAAVSPRLRGKSAPDSDEELLAAMLPHIPHQLSAATSPGFEKRCGQLTGDAALDCRAKFCNGREGVDAACAGADATSR